MLCQKCNKHEASVKYTEIINGEKNAVILKFLFDIDAFFITPSSILKTEKDTFIYRTDY